MGYLGYKPADKPLTSADITDSIITSAKIVDGTIANADISSTAAIATTKLGTGAVLQVVTATDSTNRTTTSQTYTTASNTLSATITPSSTSNKIFILVSTGAGNSAATLSYYTIYRDSTNLASADGMTQINVNNSTNIWTPLIMSYLDSPSTTSAITYQVYCKGSTGTTYLVYNNQLSSITLMEIKA